MEDRQQGDERLRRSARAKQWAAQPRDVLRHEEGAGPRGFRRGAVARVDHEGNLLRLRGLEGRHAGDPAVRIAIERRAERLGELAEREPGWLDHRRYGFGGDAPGATGAGAGAGPLAPGCRSYARMISSVRSASFEA